MEPQSKIASLDARLNRRRLLVASGAGGVAMFLAACGAGSSTRGKAGSLGLTTAEVDFFSEQFDPIILTGFDKLLAAMFDCPFLVDDNGAVAPGVVTKWEESADGAAYTLHMRDDVKFHDGTACTSEDLAFAYQRSITDGVDTASDWVGILGKTPQIDIVDPLTITVHTQGPQPLFLPLSTHLSGIWIVPKKYIDAKGTKYFSSNPIGTGPYKFASHVPGSEINFKAVDYKHWRVQPTFTTIKARLIPNTDTAIAELRGGNVDAIGVTPMQAKNLRDSGYKTLDVEQAQVYFTINGAYSPSIAGQPLSDVRVRQALSYAINRQELINTIMQGSGSLPAPGRCSLTMPDVTPDLRSKWTAWSQTNIAYDVNKAKDLLSQAGYANGFKLDFWVKQGNSSVPYLQDFGEILASYWQKIGIQVTQTVISGDLYSSIGNPAKSTKGVNKVILGNTGLSKASLVENIDSVYDVNGAFNGFYGDAALQAQFDAANTKALSAADSTVLATALDQMIQIMADSWTTVPVLQVPSITAFSKRVDPVIPKTAFGMGDTYAFWKSAKS